MSDQEFHALGGAVFAGLVAVVAYALATDGHRSGALVWAAGAFTVSVTLVGLIPFSRWLNRMDRHDR